MGLETEELNENVLDQLNTKYRCRTKIFKTLFNWYGGNGLSYPGALLVSGMNGVGKNTIVTEFFKTANISHTTINALEADSTRVLLEQIYVYLDFNNTTVKCTSVRDFISRIRRLDDEKSEVIIIRNAHIIAEKHPDVFEVLIRLRQLTRRKISVVLISHRDYEMLAKDRNYPKIYELHMPPYSPDDLNLIFSGMYQNVRATVMRNQQFNDYKERFHWLTDDVYEDFLKLFLKVYHPVTHDLAELRKSLLSGFEKYCVPIVFGEIDKNDKRRLWKYINDYFCSKLSNVSIPSSGSSLTGIKKRITSLQLPTYGKYILIAAFIASYNPPKDDKRLFVKNHGKQRKRLNAEKHKRTDKISIQCGPKAFKIDRLLAIFYALVEESVPMSIDVMSLITTLIRLNLISLISDESKLLDNSARLQCLLSFDEALELGKDVNINIRKYISDLNE